MSRIQLFKEANLLNLEEARNILIIASENNEYASRSFATHCKNLINAYCDKQLSAAEQLYLIINPSANRTCVNCGNKLMVFYGPSKGWGQYCSIKCSTSSDNRKKKYTETSVKKYGVLHPKQLDCVNEKAKQTNLLKYGHICNLQAQQFRQQIQTKINDKKDITKEKIKQTCLSRYGITSGLQSDKALRTIKQSHLNAHKNRDELRIELLSKSGFTLIKRNDNFIHEWKHSCGNEIYSLSINLRCDKCELSSNRSKIEIEIFNFVKDIRPDLTIEHSFKPFSDSKKHVDIFIKELNLGIEINGTYWHRVELDNGSMLNKTIQAEKDGFQLIHIWDNEWNNFTKEFLIAKLAKSNKIYARNTTVKFIDVKTSASFCKLFHRQGSIGAKFHIGLYHGKELVSVLTIGKPRFNKTAEWEILRFCTAHKLTVIGGFNKMLAFFEKNANPKSISTYVDRAWGNGSIYRNAGFTFVKNTSPGYFWTNSSGLVLPRYQTQKAKLLKLFGDNIEDITLSESKIMSKLNFWKCETVGNLYFEKHY